MRFIKPIILNTVHALFPRSRHSQHLYTPKGFIVVAAGKGPSHQGLFRCPKDVWRTAPGALWVVLWLP